MAAQTANYGGIQSFIAGGTITANRLVKLDSTAGQVIVTTTITEQVVGIALDTVASGELVSVLTMSGAKGKVTASAAISLGAEVMPGASGKCATAAGATAISCGIAASAAGADGDIIEVIFRPSVKSPANS